MDCNGQHAATVPRANDPDRTTRPANMIYWAGCVLALIWLAFWPHAMAINSYHDTGMALGVTLVGAAVIWMIGRAIRYVMIGR